MQGQNAAGGPDVQLLLKILLELEEQLSRDEPFVPVCVAFLQQLMDTMQIRKSALLMFEPKDNQLVMRVSLGIGRDHLRFTVDPAAFHNLLARRHHILHLSDPPPELSKFFRKNQPQLAILDTLFWVPVRAKNALLGYLAVGPKRHSPGYTAAEYHMLRLISQMLGFTLYNEILLESVKKQNQERQRFQRENKALRGISISLKAVSDSAQVMKVVLTQAGKLLHSREGLILTVQPASPFFRIAAHTGLSENLLKSIHLPKNAPALAACFAQQEGIFMETSAEPRLHQLFRHPQLLTAPLRINREPYGIILLGERSADAPSPQYGPAERQLLSDFARYAGLSIQNFQTYRQVRRRENQFKKLLNRLPLGIISINPAGQIEFANAQFARLSGQPAARLSGSHYPVLFREEPMIIELIRQCATIGKALRQQHYTPRGGFPGVAALNLLALPLNPGSTEAGGVILSIENLPDRKTQRAVEEAGMGPETAQQFRTLRKTSPTGRAETATVMNLTLRNLPALAQQMLPEQLTDALNRYLLQLQNMIWELEGIIHRLSPEETVVIAGIPPDGKTNADRVYRCITNFTGILQKINHAQSAHSAPAILWSVGVATGRLAWGQPEGQPPWFVGQSLHLARHLATIARENEVLVCPTTRQLLQAQAHFLEGRDSPSGGREDQPLTAFPLKPEDTA